MGAISDNIRNKKYTTREKLLIVLIGFSLFPAAIFSIPFAGFQLSIFRALVVYFAVVLVLPNFKRGHNPYCSFMIVWLFYGIVSIVLCDDRGAWGREIFFLFVACAVTMVCCYSLKDFRVFITACKLFCIILLIHHIIGYYEIATRDYHWIQEKSYAYYMRVLQPIPVSTFFNPNDFATVLLFGIAVSVICVRYTDNIIKKIFYIALTCSSVYLIVRTLSRANLVGVIIGVVAFLLIHPKVSQKKMFFGLLALITIGLLFVFGPLDTLIQDFTNQYLNFSLTYGSETGRMNLLSYGWKAFLKTFGVGAGAGNLANKIAAESGMSAGSLHFWWLEVLFTYGVLIWIGYIACYIGLIRSSIKNAKAGSFVSRVFAAFLLAYLVGACSSSSGMGNETIWCAWGIMIAYQYNIACTDNELTMGIYNHNVE